MSLGKGVLRGSILSYGSFIISKALVYLSTLALARLLAPRDFGLVGYALLSISLLDVMKDFGVTTALIYRQDMGDDEAGDAFTLNVASGLVFCALCWALSPLAAAFFHDPRVTTLTRALGLSFILYGLGGTHGALLQKRLRFGRGFLPDLAQGAVKGGVSIGLALHGLGYWSLVWGHLAGVAAMTGANWLLFPWRPRLGLHRDATRCLLGYGLQITLISLLGVIIYNGDYLIVGRVLGSTSLGLYTLAYSIPQMLTLSLSIALSRVFFPAYAAIQGDRAGLRHGYLTVLHYSALVLTPLGLGLRVAIVGRLEEAAPAVRAAIAAHGLERYVALLGQRRDVAALLAAADLFVLPSLWEGLPLALLEAMAAGTPVVATAVGGTPRVVEDGVMGRLAPPGDAAGLASAIGAMLADPKGARRMALAGQAHVRATYGADTWADHLQRIYSEVAVYDAGNSAGEYGRRVRGAGVGHHYRMNSQQSVRGKNMLHKEPTGCLTVKRLMRVR